MSKLRRNNYHNIKSHSTIPSIVDFLQEIADKLLVVELGIVEPQSNVPYLEPHKSSCSLPESSYSYNKIDSYPGPPLQYNMKVSEHYLTKMVRNDSSN
jgi:hypothetical protein